MKLGRLALVAAASVGFGASAFAGNGSNFLQLMNGIDYYFGGTLANPNFPPANVTNGVWRCYTKDVLHSPTRVIDPNNTPVTVGQYASKICSLHFTACASTGTTATWPTIALSSSDGDCRFAPGGVGNYAFGSAGAGFGWFCAGPTNGTGGVGGITVLALIGGVTFGGPFSISTATGAATVYGLQLNLQPIFGSPSTIAVPEGESMVYWIADDKAEGPGAYQYWTGSNDERTICSSVSFICSGISATGGSIFGLQTVLEWGMFVAQRDASLMAAVAPSITDNGGANTTMGAANPMDTGTGGLTLSLTGVSPEGGTGLGFDVLSFNSYDEGNAFGGSGKLLFANLMAVNGLASPSCGPWSPGYIALPTGGAGGPSLGAPIPQDPRIVGQLDVVALALIQNPVWTLTTGHNVATSGNEYPMFPGFAALMGGSTGNNQGFGIPVPALPALVGVQLFFSGIGLTGNWPTPGAIAKQANNGHSHQNGYATLFFP